VPIKRQGETISDPLIILCDLLNPLNDSLKIRAAVSGLEASEWGALQRHIETRSLANSLYARLNQEELLPCLPVELREFLRENYRVNAARNLILLNRAAQVLAALKNQRIQVIGLKGLYLLENVYQDIGARAMNDLDILVHREDIPRALETLQNLSYQVSTFFDSSAPNRDVKHVPPLNLADGTIIEVHWTLLEEEEPFNIAVEGMWQRARTAYFAESEAYALSDEDLLLHLCIHAAYQHYLKLGLRGMLDIALVLKQASDQIDWQQLIQTAREWGARKCVGLCFGLLQEMGWARLPEGLMADLLPEGLDADIINQAKVVLLRDESEADAITPDLSALTSTRNLVRKTRVVLDRIFIPKTAIARLYGINPGSPGIVFGYLRRAVDLYQQYGGTIRKASNLDKAVLQELELNKIRTHLHHWLTNA